MNLLAVETSSATASVALSANGEIRETLIATPREQAARILPVTDALLAEAGLTLGGLDAVVFGQGPGSFTGLRVAAAVAQGLAMSAQRPVLGVSSLAAMAQGAWRAWAASHVLACVDARMGEVYWARFEHVDGLARLQGRERIGAPTEVETPAVSAWTAVGSGFATNFEELAALGERADRLDVGLEPRAQDLLPQARADFAAGLFVPLDTVLPTYLRDQNAWRRL
jgi:tRNA threonylcarbamoyladenosine biosynthesis protein TsaB